MTTHIEQEATFEGPGVLDPALLRRVPGVARVRAEEPEELDAVYYDTADLRLLAHGITLRRRDGGHDEGWHLKLPGSGGQRLEVHVPPRTVRPAEVPQELYRRIAAYARGAELLPVAHVRTHRTRHSMLDGRGRRLAEAAQDEVDAQILGTERLRPGRPAPQGAPSRSSGTSTRLSHWSEVEIETDAGGAELLRAAARELRTAGWRPSPDPRKLGHALAPVLPADFGSVPPVNAWGRGSAGEAVATRLRDQVRILLSLDAAVRVDEPDAVHRMRSTARRLRNLLRGHRRLLDRGRTDPVAAELRWLTRALGASRDHEVLGTRLYDQGRALRGPADPGFAEAVRDEERARHEEGLRAAVAALDSRRCAALLDALEDLVDDPPLREGRARRPAAEHLRKAAARDRKRLERRMAAVRRAEPGPARDRALHSARKAARRARHTAETAEPYAGKPAKRLRKRTKALQGLLGEHQDAVLARAELLDLAAQARAAGRDTYAHGRLHALQDQLALEARAALPAAWRRARKRRLVHFA